MLSLREEWCSCLCALLTLCSQPPPLALSNEISSSHRNSPTHSSSLATGLINLSIKKEDLCFRNCKICVWGGGNTSFDCSGGMFLNWSTREAVWGGRTAWISLGYTARDCLQNEMKGAGNERKGERKQEEKRRRRGKRSWDSFWVKILPVLFHGKTPWVRHMTTEIQFLSQSILSGHKTTNSGEDFLGRLLGTTHEVFFFFS